MSAVARTEPDRDSTLQWCSEVEVYAPEASAPLCDVTTHEANVARVLEHNHVEGFSR